MANRKRRSRRTAGEHLSETARLETFADGVIAIAITLLILEIEVPEAGTGESLAHALGRQWPSYAAYVVSFLTIGIIWINHHHLFGLIERANNTFLVLNVVFLMAIAALPWPTALVAEHLQNADNRATATLVYGGTMVAIAIMFNVVWRYASSGGRLLPEGVDQNELERTNRAYLAGPIVYGLATLLALANAWVSLAIYAGLALFYTLPTSGPNPGRLRPNAGSRPGSPR